MTGSFSDSLLAFVVSFVLLVASAEAQGSSYPIFYDSSNNAPYGIAQVEGRALIVEYTFPSALVGVDGNGSPTPIASSGIFSPGGVAVLSENGSEFEVLITGQNDGIVFKVDHTGAVVHHATGLRTPVDIAIMPDGWSGSQGVAQYAFSEFIENRISLLPVAGGGDRTFFAEGLSQPRGFHVFEDGSMLVAEWGSNRVSMVSPTGVRSDFASGLSGPYDVAVLSDGTILVAEQGSVNRVSQLMENGTRVDYANGIESPRDIFELSDGRVLVSDWGTGHVLEIGRTAIDTEAEREALAALTVTRPSPNPVQGLVRFRLLADAPLAARAEIVDMYGRLVREVYAGDLVDVALLEISTDGLAAGIYTLRATGDGTTVSRPFTVVR